MADAKPQEMDPALVERGALTICANSEANSGYEDAFCARSCVTCRNQYRAAIATLDIPAAALNAIAKGEAVVVNVTWACEMEKRGLGSVLYTRT